MDIVTNARRYITVAAVTAILFFIIGSIITAQIKADPTTVRFETRFSATTLDNVELEVRIIGWYSKDIDLSKEYKNVVTIVNGKFSLLNYDELPLQKLRVLFREELEDAKRRGITIDSFSISRKDN